MEELWPQTQLMRSLRTAFTKDGKLSGLKSHDWHKMCQVCHR